MIGSTISHYRILNQIGAGGMGVVYLAEDDRLHRKVALKFLPPSVAHDAAAKARFWLEAEAASALDHPHIATVYEIGEYDGELFLAMAYYEGETLKQRLERGPLTVSAAASIAEQIASGLSAAHAAGIVHRDLKPANIFVRGDGQVKILDFGLAKMLAMDETRAQLTRVGSTVGTVAYMSSEQVRGEDVDSRTDVWALGVVLYEMLTGRLPFEGAHPVALMSAIASDTPPSFASLPPETPRELHHVLAGALVKDRHARHRTAADVERLVAAYRLRASSGTLQAASPALSDALTRKRVLLPAALVFLLVAAGGAWAANRNAHIRWATDRALPAISQLAEQDKVVAAFTLAEQANQYIPTDQILAKLWSVVSRTVSVDTVPAGASVSYREYSANDGPWTHLGRTPLHDVRVPSAILRWKIEKDGFATTEDAAGFLGLAGSHVLSYRLSAFDAVPSGMVRVSSAGSPFSVVIPGLEHLPAVRLPDYWIDRFEVTNRAFRRFVTDGGYQKREFWKQPFERDGRTLRWQDAMTLFHDATGRPGPSTWELGSYPSGQDDYPVTGVSWFEAGAYAEYAGKTLPTLYHWSYVASQQSSASFVPPSNFGGRGPTPVGASQAANRFGAFDMAGNVKEWVWNSTAGGQRYLLGGAWDEPVYMFNDADARSPFDREATFGFRCAKLGGETLKADITAPIEYPSRNYANEKPVSAEVFEAYRSLYSYDKGALNARSEGVDRAEEDWTREKVGFDAAYGKERMAAYLFLPKTGTPPYQTAVYFPGSGPMSQPSFEALTNTRSFDYIMKSGRALAYPVYKSTFERRDGLASDTANTTSLWRDHVIMWSKDLGRTLDFLDTRSEIAHDQIAFVGASWGGAMGAILPAVEPRIKAVVLIVGGFDLNRSLPEVDAINFAPRITVPTLMLNGKYDFFFPTDTTQVPLFHWLGAPPEHKRRVVYETGHSIPRTEQIKEVLGWLDTYLGPVAGK
jgi:eukaryotic-like serine/threonine-protein kinase